MGPVKMASLLTAIDLDLFDLTDESSPTAEEVTAALGSHDANTRLLLDTLTAMGLLTKRKGCYTNTDLAATFLVSPKPTWLGEMFVSMAAPSTGSLGTSSSGSSTARPPSPRK